MNNYEVLKKVFEKGGKCGLVLFSKGKDTYYNIELFDTNKNKLLLINNKYEQLVYLQDILPVSKFRKNNFFDFLEYIKINSNVEYSFSFLPEDLIEGHEETLYLIIKNGNIYHPDYFIEDDCEKYFYPISNNGDQILSGVVLLTEKEAAFLNHITNFHNWEDIYVERNSPDFSIDMSCPISKETKEEY